MRNRKDFSAVIANDELNETALAKMLGKAPSTVRRWRMLGHTPTPRQVHLRLYAYKRADVEAYTAKGLWPAGTRGSRLQQAA